MKWGRCIIAAGFIVISVSAGLGLVFAHQHPEMAHVHETQISTPWAQFNQLLAGILAAVLSLTTLRDAALGRWMLGLLSLTVVSWVAVRVSMDPRCLGALHEHGCHTFLIGIAIVIVGCAISAVGMMRKT